MKGEDASRHSPTKLAEALKGEIEISTNMSQVDKIKIVDKERSVMILCLRNKILRDVAKEKIVVTMWARLTFM